MILPPPRARSRHGGLGQAEVALHVHVENLVPMALLGRKERAEVGVGGRVVDQDIQAAEVGHRLRHQGRRGLRLTGMGDHAQCLAPLPPDDRHRLIDGRLLAAGHHHPRPGHSIRLGDSQTNTPRPTGDQRYLARQIEVRSRRHIVLLAVSLAGHRARI